MIDLKILAVREDAQRLFDAWSGLAPRLLYLDQDALNVTLQNEIHPIEMRWMSRRSCSSGCASLGNWARVWQRIIHFTTRSTMAPQEAQGFESGRCCLNNRIAQRVAARSWRCAARVQSGEDAPDVRNRPLCRPSLRQKADDTAGWRYGLANASDNVLGEETTWSPYLDGPSAKPRRIARRGTRVPRVDEGFLQRPL